MAFIWIVHQEIRGLVFKSSSSTVYTNGGLVNLILRMRNRTAGIFIAVLLLAGLTGCSNSTQSYSVPKVHDCYDISEKEFESPFALTAPVDCDKEHNAETYIVAKWDNEVPPFKLSEEVKLKVFEKICLPWPMSDNTFMNTWGFYSPSQKDWKEGNRWVRCDAMTRQYGQDGKAIFVSWKGLESLKKTSALKEDLLKEGDSVVAIIDGENGQCLDTSPLKEGDTVSLVEKSPDKDNPVQILLATAELEVRLEGCGFGINFELNISPTQNIGIVYDDTRGEIIGEVGLTVDADGFIAYTNPSKKQNKTPRTLSDTAAKTYTLFYQFIGSDYGINARDGDQAKAMAEDARNCGADAWYPKFTTGAILRISDENGKLISVGKTVWRVNQVTETGRNPRAPAYDWLAECALVVTIKKLPKAAIYQMTLDNRDAGAYSFEELVDSGWNVTQTD